MYNQKKFLELLNAFREADNEYQQMKPSLLAVTKSGRNNIASLSGHEEVGHIQHPLDDRIHDLWIFAINSPTVRREMLSRFRELATRGGVLLPDVVRNAIRNRPRTPQSFTLPTELNWWFEFMWHFYPSKVDVFHILTNPELASRPLIFWENAFSASVDAIQECGLGTHKLTIPTQPLRVWHNRGTVSNSFGPNMVIPPEEELWNEAIDGPLPDLVELEDFELMQGLVRDGDTLRFDAEVGKLRTKERDDFEEWQQSEAVKVQQQHDDANAARLIDSLKRLGMKVVPESAIVILDQRERANISKLFSGELPEDTDIIDLVVRIDAQKGNGKSRNQIAREFTKESAGNDTRAQSLLASLRRLKRENRLNLD